MNAKFQVSRLGEGGNKEGKKASPEFESRISHLVDLCLNHWTIAFVGFLFLAFVGVF